jgi:hypothetical protein
MREVCGPSGCQSYPTRECTTEQRCQDVPREVCRTVDRTRCEQVRIQDRCWEERVVRYRTEEYSCTKTRQVPIGTQTDEDRLVNITIRMSGDLESLSGNDQFELSVPTGIDVSDFGYELKLSRSEDSHLIYVIKSDERKQTPSAKNTLINVLYDVRVIEKSKFKPINFSFESLEVTHKTLIATLSHEKISKAGFKAYLVIEKDQSLGGYKTLFSQAIPAQSFQLSESGDDQQKLSLDLIELGVRFNNRPHRFTLKIETEGSPEILKNLVNPRILEKMNLKTSLSQVLRTKL